MENPSKDDMTFSNEDSWMVQCLNLAALGMLAYLHIAPVVANAVY